VSLVYSPAKSSSRETAADVKRESDRRGRLSYEDCVNRGHEFARERVTARWNSRLRWKLSFLLRVSSRLAFLKRLAPGHEDAKRLVPISGSQAAVRRMQRAENTCHRASSRAICASLYLLRFSRVRAYLLSRFPSVLICPSFSFSLPHCLSSVFRLSPCGHDMQSPRGGSALKVHL